MLAEDDGGLSSVPGTVNISVNRNDHTPQVSFDRRSLIVRSDTPVRRNLTTCSFNDLDSEVSAMLKNMMFIFVVV